MADDATLCSTIARQRAEPMAGSAPRARRWLLVEHPGPWARDPLLTPPLVDHLAALEAALAAAEARVLLIRPVGRRPPGRQAWYAVDPVTRRQVSGFWDRGSDLVAVAEGLVPMLDTSTQPAEPMVLVCTHGVRDRCCAVRGRPVAAALEAELAEAVWECSHLGGHRFASTLLVLPEGACYGGLDGDTAPAAVREHRAGAVPSGHLRGVASQPPAVQAAVAWLLGRFGPAALDDVTVGEVLETQAGLRVELLGTGRLPSRAVAVVKRRELAPSPLSCGAEPEPHAAYDVSPA